MRIAAAVVCLALAAGCDQTPPFQRSRTQLKGQVFVVTEGASNLRLGDVPVSFYSEAQLNAWQLQARRRHSTHQQALTQLIQQLKSTQAEEEHEKSELANFEAQDRKADDEIAQKIIEYANAFAAAHNDLISQEETNNWPNSHGLEDQISSILGQRGEWNHRTAIAALQKQYMPFASAESASAYIAKSVAIMDYETVTSEERGIYPFDRRATPDLVTAYTKYASRSLEIKNRFGSALQMLRANRPTLAKAYQEKKQLIFDRTTQLANRRRELESSISEINSIAANTFDLSALPASVLTVRTDANGEFNCELANEKLGIYVSATRRLPTGGQEHYTWLLWLLPKSPTKNVILSNSNVLDANFAQTGTIPEYTEH